MSKRPSVSITSLGELTPHPRNPRDISPEALDSLRRSQRALGDISGIVYNFRTKHVVAGHQRLKNIAPDSPFIVDEQTADDVGTVGYGHVAAFGTRWPVRFVDWDEPRELAALAAANNLALQGRYTSAVAELVADIAAAIPELADDLRLDDIEASVLDDEDAAVLDRAAGDGAEIPEMELRPFEHYDYIVVVARNIHDWNYLADLVGLQRVNASPITGKRKIGVGRAIEARRLIDLVEAKKKGSARA